MLSLVLLLVSDLAIWAGFFTVMPFLPDHMTSLGHSGTLVGLILALRLLSQQGTMPLSGALADRWGYRRALLYGLLLRAGGFALLALAHSVGALAATAILSGMGGSLIGSALKAAYTVAPGGADLATRFLWLTIADRLGQVVGPLLGAASRTFRGQASLGALIFLTTAATVWVGLREQDTVVRQPLLESMRTQVRNRPLLGLVVVLCGYWAVQNQLSVLIPLAAAQVGLRQEIGTLFSLSALAGLLLIFLMPRVRMEHLWYRLLLAQGLTAAAMLPPLVLPGFGGILLATMTLAVAAVIGQPAMDALVGALSPASVRASAYGFAALSFGLGGAAGQVLGGWAWARWGESSGWVPWSLFAALGLITWICLAWLKRGVELYDRP